MFISKPRAGAFKRMLLACSAVAAVAAATPALAQSPSGGAAVSFAIDSQSMEEALTTLARTADVQVLFAPEAVRGRRANRVVGVLAPAEALRRMVEGTGLTVTPVGARTFSVAVAHADLGSDGVTAIEDVIVTAQKRAQRIQDVPLAVTMLNGEDALRRGIDSVTDLVDEVPGVSVNYAFGGTNYGLISIRGIGGADDYKPNGNPSVALHVDARRQHGHARGDDAAPILAPRHQRISGDGVASLVLPGLAQLGVDPDLQAGGILGDARMFLCNFGPSFPRGIER